MVWYIDWNSFVRNHTVFRRNCAWLGSAIRLQFRIVPLIHTQHTLTVLSRLSTKNSGGSHKTLHQLPNTYSSKTISLSNHICTPHLNKMKLPLDHANQGTCLGATRSLEWGDAEDPATTSTRSLVDSKFAQPQAPKKECHSVRFDEADNQEYANTVLTHEECADLWYTTEELICFRGRNRLLARSLHCLEIELSGKPNTFGKIYTTVYRKCCEAQSDNDVATSCCEGSVPVDIFTLGMERRAISYVARDVSGRRKILWREVLYWQETPMVSGPDLRAHMIAQVCAVRSRASRLYARYVAHVSAITEL
jgi:hypothetical protein